MSILFIASGYFPSKFDEDQSNDLKNYYPKTSKMPKL